MSDTANATNLIPVKSKYDHLTEGFRNHIGKGRPKGRKNKRTQIIEEKLPGLTQFLNNFPQDKQAKVKNYIGFKCLLEAHQMVDIDAKPAEQFSRRLQIVDRTLPRTQDIHVENKTALVVGKLGDLLKIYANSSDTQQITEGDNPE